MAEKGVSWDDRPIDLMRYENLEPWFQRINAKGVVPVLIHHDKIVTESLDIIDYIDTNFEGRPLKGRDRQSAQLIDAALCRADAIQWCVKTLTYQYIFKPAGRMSADDLVEYRRRQTNSANVQFMEEFVAGFSNDRIARCFAEAHGLMEFVEELLGKTNAFVCGSELSLGDIALIVNIERLHRLGLSFRDVPRVVAWRARIHGRPSWSQAMQVML